MKFPSLAGMRFGPIALAAGLLAGAGCSTPPMVPEVSLPAEYNGEVLAPSKFVRAPIALPPTPDYIQLRRELRLDRRQTVFARIEYVVDESGVVIAGRVVETNNPAFAQTLLAQLSRVRFVPGSREGRPVKVRMTMNIGSALRS